MGHQARCKIVRGGLRAWGHESESDLVTTTLRLSVTLTAVLWCAVPAYAQLTQPQLRQGRPARGLFGGGVGATEQQLILTGSLGGGYDKDQGGSFIITPENPAGTVADWSGQYAMGSTQLAYTLNRSTFSAGASGFADGRYKPNDTGDNFIQAYGATGQVAAQLSSRTTISATQSISRQPRNLGMLYGTGYDPLHGRRSHIRFERGDRISDLPQYIKRRRFQPRPELATFRHRELHVLQPGDARGRSVAGVENPQCWCWCLLCHLENCPSARGLQVQRLRVMEPARQSSTKASRLTPASISGKRFR